MTDVGLHIRCQRCGADMDMRDPAPDKPWTPDQFWVCPRCGRHFWSTYPPPNREKAKPADVKPAEAKPVDAKPADAKPADVKPPVVKPAEAKPAEPVS